MEEKQKDNNQDNINPLIKSKYTHIRQSIEKYLSSDELWAIVKETLYRWENSDKSTVVYSEEVHEQDEKVGIIFSVASSDWAGMSEACVGVVHSRGFNVWRLAGFVVEAEKRIALQEVGMIIMYIKPKDPNLQEELFEARDSLSRMLVYSSTGGGTGAAALVASESSKVQKMAMVIKYIERALQDDPKLSKDISGPEGETAKFFASRSTEYITDRLVKQLGDQIITNYKLIDQVRKSGKGEIFIENMTTRKEELTCITVVGKQEMFSVDEVFLRLDHALPKYKRKYDKTFTTRDGIKIIRLEITNQWDEFYLGDELERIKRTLIKCVNKITSFDEAILSKNILPGGQEHYARAIIPMLIREYENSKITQVYMAQSYSNEFFMSMKLLIVTAKVEQGKELELKILEGIENINGFFVANCMPPRTYGSYFVYDFDIQADLDIFTSKYEVINKLKEYLSLEFKNYRDFDEGMRRSMLSKLEEIKRDLADYDQTTVEEIYYFLDGFHRYQAGVDELVLEIKAGIESLDKARSNIDKSALEIVDIPSRTGDYIKSTVIAMVTKDRIKIKKCVSELMKRFELTLCKVNEDPFILIILNITSQGKGLNNDEIQTILDYCQVTVH
ncbi:MAG: hypothetical protein ACP5FK_02420 [bacterium]